MEVAMRIADRPEFKSKAKPLTALASEMVADVAGRMTEKNFGSVAVIDDASRVVGIFTERDLMRRVVAPGKDPHNTPVAAVMTTDVKVANASDEVVAWLRQMSNERFRHVPVVDGDGQLVHMMSQGDFVSYTWPELLTRLKEEVGYAYPKVSSSMWLMTGMAVYTLVMIGVLTSVM
jgi:CBS domain-containing protein